MAQPFPDLKFTRLTEKNGLTNDGVKWVTQDDEGFIWIGTHDGLNRYDGYQIKKFYHHPEDSKSLVNNDIVSIVPGYQKKILVITKEGTCYYDKLTNSFTTLKNAKENKSNFLKNVSLSSNKENDISFVPLYQRLSDFYSRLKNQQMIIRLAGKEIKLIDFGFEYNHTYEDRQKQVWIYSNQWLIQLDSAVKNVLNVYTKSQGIISFYQDSNMNYWMGTFAGGLFKFNPQNKEPFQAIVLTPGSQTIFAITEWKDKDNKQWIVTGTGAGLFLINSVNYKSKIFLPEKDNDSSIPGSEVNDVFVDRQNILWMSTSSGLGYVEPGKQLITSWKIPSTGEEKTLVATGTDRTKKGFFSSFYNDTSGYWSSNFIMPGLIKYNDSGAMQLYMKNLCPSCAFNLLENTSQAFGIYKQNNGVFWFSTNAGLVSYAPDNKKLSFYKPEDGDGETGFRTILSYNDSLLWIRTRNNANHGIYVFNINQKKFVNHYYYTDGCNNCLPPNLMAMLITHDKHIYTTPANHFLYTYDSTAHNFIPVKLRDEHAIFPATTFESLAEDSSGNLWIGTLNGLFLFDPVHRTIVKDYSGDKKIGGVEIEALCLDDEQNLWMNTERGLFCLVHNTGQIYNFNSGDGLPGNSLPGFLAKGKNGCLLAGSWGYVVKFKPAELLHHRIDGEVHFSDATIMNELSAWEMNKKNIRTLTLLPGQNNFSVDFAILNFDDASGNRYYYKLDGLSNDLSGDKAGWKENANGHLSFYDLPPGNYLLHVKGGNKYGETFKQEDLLAVVVKPYWWQTTLFRVCCLAALGAFVFILLRRRIQNIRREAAFKQKIAETEMMALRSQMNPHFIFNSLNGIEYFVLQNDKRNASDYLNKFASLIRIILSNSRKEGVPFADDLQTIQLYIDLELLRFNNSFCYTTDIDKALLDFDYHVPPLLIQPFVENSIIHGFAYSDKKNLQLKISAKLKDEYIFYTIEDNGVGRAEASVYNAINKPNHTSLGLQITQQRISIFNEQHHAHSMVSIEDLYDDNRKACGTKVTVKIKTI